MAFISRGYLLEGTRLDIREQRLDISDLIELHRLCELRELFGKIKG